MATGHQQVPSVLIQSIRRNSLERCTDTDWTNKARQVWAAQLVSSGRLFVLLLLLLLNRLNRIVWRLLLFHPKGLVSNESHRVYTQQTRPIHYQLNVQSICGSANEYTSSANQRLMFTIIQSTIYPTVRELSGLLLCTHQNKFLYDSI